MSRINLITNPSFETGVTGWSSAQSESGVLREQSPLIPIAGSWYAYARRTTTGQLSFNRNVSAPVVPGNTYRASVYINRDGTNQVALDLDWYDANDTYISSSTGTLTPSSGTWARISVAASVAPSNAYGARMFLRFLNQGANQYVRVDAALLENTSTLGTYFDGSYSGYDWMGTAHASFSLSEAYRYNLAVNPSGETDARGWSSLATGTATAQSVLTLASTGGYGDDLIYCGGYGPSGGSIYVRGPGSPCASGVTYTVSILDLYGELSVIGIDWLDASGAQVGTSVTKSVTPSSGRIFVNGTAPAGAVRIRPFIAHTLSASATSNSNNDYFFFDGLMIEPIGTYSDYTKYFDGNTINASWSGQTNISPSTYDALPVASYSGAATLVTNPSVALGNPQQNARAALNTSVPTSVSATVWQTMVASATLTAGAVASGNGYAIIPVSAPAQITTSPTVVANAGRRTSGTVTLTSTETFVGVVPTTPASAQPMTSAATSVSVDAKVSRSGGALITSTTTAVSASGDIIPADGSVISTKTTVGALAQLIMPVSVQTSADTSVEADAFVTTELTTDEPNALTTDTTLAIDGIVTRPASALLTVDTTVSADPLRTTYAQAKPTTSTVLRSAINGQEYLGTETSVSTDPIAIHPVSVSTSAGTSVSAEATAQRRAMATLVTQTSVAANVIAVRSMALTLVTQTSVQAQSGAPQKVASATITTATVVQVSARVQTGTGSVLIARTTVSASADQLTPVFATPSGIAKPQVRVPTMRLLVADTISGRIGWELPFTDLSWSSPLNKAGNCSATVIYEQALESLYAQGARDPRAALRETLNGPGRFSYVVAYGTVPLWAGTMEPSVDVPADKQTVAVGGTQLHALLADRRLINIGPGYTGKWSDPSRDVTFRQTNAADAIYRIVQHATSTSGNAFDRYLPFVCSNPPKRGGDEDFAYLSYDLVDAWKAISDLTAREDGPDFRLKPYLYDGTSATYLAYDIQIGDPFLPSTAPPGDSGPLPWTFDDATSAMERSSDGIGLASVLYVGGSGQDREKLIARAHSETLRDLGFPAREKTDTGNTSETDQDKLAKAANGMLHAHDIPTETWKMKAPIDGRPPVGAVQAGDMASLEIYNHALVEPGVYRRRITEVSGDSSGMYSVTCAAEDSDMVGV